MAVLLRAVALVRSNWKPCGRAEIWEVKAKNRQLSKKADWKGKKRNRADARGRSGDWDGLFTMEENCSY